jgi:hypothetical protein
MAYSEVSTTPECLRIGKPARCLRFVRDPAPPFVVHEVMGGEQ